MNYDYATIMKMQFEKISKKPTYFKVPDVPSCIDIFPTNSQGSFQETFKPHSLITFANIITDSSNDYIFKISPKINKIKKP